jgi:hypothetical protein
MTDTKPGFAPILVGWNVWDVWQKNSLDFEIGGVGLTADRRLRIFVEKTADSAPGSAISDPLNPGRLVGDLVDVLPNAAGLEQDARKEDVPGAALLLDGPATLHTVRFFNRGRAGVVSWPHTSNYLLDKTYLPSAENPVTNAPAPPTLGGTAADAAGTLSEVVKGAVALGVVIGGLVLLAKLKGK